MPATIAEGPSVALSFANCFWGQSDAGVEPLLQRMHNAKQTCDEVKSFYSARAALEDEYARKLLSLSRKALGSQESGTLRTSLDVLRGEVEQMGKSHQNIASQMKTELEEPLAAFAGAMKERRKIVQNGIEKLLKVKIQQTQQVNKTRDKYEQECLKIKGYLAQGHMVMGQEERKNKAKLEKTQINLATSNTEYENAVKVLEETTGRWNRDWKAAADKFQDLEEERLDFMKSSLWTYANIASTVCVSDDASCEKVRLSLENCEVEKDIVGFIKERGTGQEIPDPPKYINFCRGDISDTQSESSEDGSYSVAQFQRTINPAYRSSSPVPSTFESHHDPHSAVARELSRDPSPPPIRETTITPQKVVPERNQQAQQQAKKPRITSQSQSQLDYSPQPIESLRSSQTRSQPQIQPQSRSQPQLDYQNQPTESLRSSQTRSQPQIQPQLRSQPQLDYQNQPTESLRHSQTRSQPQIQPQIQPQSRSQPQLDYQNQPIESLRSSQTRSQPQIQPQSRSQPQLDYQNQPTESLRHSQTRSQPQIQPLIQPQSRSQPQLDYQNQPIEGLRHSYTRSQPQIQPYPRSQPQFDYQNQSTESLRHSQTRSKPQIQPQSKSQPQLDYQQNQSIERTRQSQPQQPVQSRPQPQLDYRQPPAERPRQQQPQPQTQSQPQIQLRQKPQPQLDYQSQPGRLQYDQSQHGPLAAVPHDPYPMDGMTMLCRTGPSSERSSAHSLIRPSSRDSNSEYSNPTSFSSQEPPSGKTSPIKQVAPVLEKQVAPVLEKQVAPVLEKQVAPPAEKQVLKKKSGFFQSHSPFRRKSGKERNNSTPMAPSNRNTWSARSTVNTNNVATSRRPQNQHQASQSMITDRPSASPEPVDPRASFQLNIGNNVFDVAAPDKSNKIIQNATPEKQEKSDPIAEALAELKGLTKASSTRVSADNYHGVLTPAPDATPKSRPAVAPARETPPPSYDQPAIQRLGLPQPAFTSKAMQQTRQKYVDQTQSMFSQPQARPDSQAGYGSQPQSRPGTRGSEMPRAASPAPPRSVSPVPPRQAESRQAESRQVESRQAESRQAYRSASPNPYGGSQRTRTQSVSPQKRGSDQGYYRNHTPNDVTRAVSPAPFHEQKRPTSSSTHISNEMAMQLAPSPEDEYGGSQSGRGSRMGGSANSRSMSYYNGDDQQVAARQRSQSVADVRQYNREGRPILHFARALYMYQAAIPEELSFAKGDVLAVLRLQDDGWWEAEVAGKNGRPGLVPSNYLQNC